MASESNESNANRESQFSYVEIFEAVKNGDLEKVDALLNADGRLLNVSDHNVSTPLTRAFAYEHFDVALMLLQRGANPFSMNHSDKWGMRYIVEKGGLSDKLRTVFVDAAVSGQSSLPGIFDAVWHRDSERVASICQSNPEQVSVRLADLDGPKGFYNDQPYCGLTPLHYAVIAGDEATATVLLENGAEVDAVPHRHMPNSRHTPLYFVPQDSGTLAERLIKHGANPKHSTSYLTEGSASMREVVVAHGAGETPLLRALITKEFDRAAEIVREDNSVIHDRLPGARYDTPLHMAVKAGNVALVEQLLDAGMDVDTPSRDGYTALAVSPEMYCSMEMFQFADRSRSRCASGW